MTIAAIIAALRHDGADDRLTRTTLTEVATVDGPVGIVSTPPGVLATASGLSLEEYSLARVIRSEGYGGAAIGKAAAAVAIGQAIRNGAGASKISITTKLVASNYENARGRYGQQRGRYAATTSDPTRWHGVVARAVLAGDVPELARGATNFVDPKVFAGGVQAGRPLGKFEDTMRSWHGTSRQLAWIGPIPTVDSYHLILLRKESNEAVRKRSLDAVMSLFRAGLAGDNEPTPGDPDSSSLPALAVAVGLAMAAMVML